VILHLPQFPKQQLIVQVHTKSGTVWSVLGKVGWSFLKPGTNK